MAASVPLYLAQFTNTDGTPGGEFLLNSHNYQRIVLSAGAFMPKTAAAAAAPLRALTPHPLAAVGPGAFDGPIYLTFISSTYSTSGGTGGMLLT